MITALVLAACLIFINKLLFALEALMCTVIDLLYSMFEVFAGIRTITYDGTKDYLLDAIFGNELVTAVYMGMACLGIALAFGFAIISLVKKLFDSSGEKVKATNGQILTNLFKSILIILLLTAIVTATLSATGVLMRQIDYLFDNAEALANPSSITFTDSQRAAMYRILDTVGNYSLNPSFNNRFNINACFNSIRGDLQLLAQDGVFNFTYIEAKNSWQYALKNIYMASNVNSDVYVDEYHEKLTDAIVACSEMIKNNASFKPLSYYSKGKGYEGDGTLGRVVMLSGSMNAANNSRFNESSSITDDLRAPYYYGTRDVYKYGVVSKDFDISLDSWNHIVIIFAAFILIKELCILLINCTARIFNIILLYIVAPGFIAVMPLDDGGKLKQWTTAFTIQALSIFGSLIAVRVMLIFIPIVMSTRLVLFSNAFANVIAKLVLVVGICITAEKANGMISGILADNAGYQSIMAGDVGGGLINKGFALAGAALKGAAMLGHKGLDALGTVTGANSLTQKAGKKLGQLGQAMRDKGGLIGGIKNGFTTDEEDSKAKEQEEKADDKENTKQFREKVVDLLGGGSDNSEKPDGAKNPPSTNQKNQNEQQNQNNGTDPGEAPPQPESNPDGDRPLSEIQ